MKVKAHVSIIVNGKKYKLRHNNVIQMLWKTFPELDELWTTGAIAEGNCVLIGDLKEINKRLEKLHK